MNNDRWIVWALVAALVFYMISNNPVYGNAFQGYGNATGQLLTGLSGNVMGVVQPASGNGQQCDQQPNWIALALSFGAGYYANRNLTPAQRRQIDDILP